MMLSVYLTSELPWSSDEARRHGNSSLAELQCDCFVTVLMVLWTVSSMEVRICLMEVLGISLTRSATCDFCCVTTLVLAEVITRLKISPIVFFVSSASTGKLDPPPNFLHASTSSIGDTAVKASSSVNIESHRLNVSTFSIFKKEDSSVQDSASLRPALALWRSSMFLTVSFM